MAGAQHKDDTHPQQRDNSFFVDVQRIHIDKSSWLANSFSRYKKDVNNTHKEHEIGWYYYKGQLLHKLLF